MATIYDYKYYSDGRHIALLQKQMLTVYDPYIKTKDELYLTPSTSDSEAILLDYTPVLNYPSNEQSVLDVNNRLAKAIVEYVKYKFAEDAEDYKKAGYHKGLFYELVADEKHKKLGGPRVAIPRGVGVLR